MNNRNELSISVMTVISLYFALALPLAWPPPTSRESPGRQQADSKHHRTVNAAHHVPSPSDRLQIALFVEEADSPMSE